MGGSWAWRAAVARVRSGRREVGMGRGGMKAKAGVGKWQGARVKAERRERKGRGGNGKGEWRVQNWGGGNGDGGTAIAGGSPLPRKADGRGGRGWKPLPRTDD
jgi:hypothetical protein